MFGENMQHKVVVAEDEAALRFMYELVLNPMGFEVFHAADGVEAVKLLEQIVPEIIFLDILLPKVNGQAILDYVRSAPHLVDTHVMIVSAHRRFEELCGPNDQFLLKPVLAADIREAVRRVMQTI